LPFVIFQSKDNIKQVDKKFLLCLEKYVDNYLEKDRIILDDSCDFKVFCHFIDFLVSGSIPIDKNYHIGVFNMLREWKSHFGIMDSFRFRLSCQKKDGIVIYNGEKYEVNIGCLFFHSGVFREFYINNCEIVFSTNLSFLKESFEVFLDLIHNRISYPSLEKAGDVHAICEYFCCDSLCKLLNDDSPDKVLRLLIQNQNENLSISENEKKITQEIDIYLKNPNLCLVPLPSLCRIFEASKMRVFSLSSLEPFLIGCLKHHGTGAKILLNSINYNNPSTISELKKFLHILSIEDKNDIYDKTNDALSSFQREFNNMREEIQRISQRNEQTINTINNRLKELNYVIEVQKSEIYSSKATIENYDKKIQEKEKEIAEKNKLIEAKDSNIAEKNKTINDKDSIIKEKVRQINKCIEGEYPLQSDLFSGIFDGISKKLSIVLADTSDIDVTASSISGSRGPKNVLKNDDTRWDSKDLPNSWIQFDFKQIQVSITSYSLNDGCFIKSWEVGGSNDGTQFDIIDRKVGTTDFKNRQNGLNHPSAIKNFTVHPYNKYYRYIRITNTDKNWNNNDQFYLWRVEFFGLVKINPLCK